MTEIRELPDGGWQRFPHIVLAVLDVMPNSEIWRAQLGDKPGLALLPADEDGYVTVMHDGDVLMKIELDLFEDESKLMGKARVMVDGRWRDLDVGWLPGVSDDTPREPNVGGDG